MLGRACNSLTMNLPSDAVSETPGRAIHHSHKIVAPLQDKDRPSPPHIGRDLAQFVNATSRTVHVGQIDRNAIYAAPVTVNSVFDTSFDLLVQILIHHYTTCSNVDFHRYLLALFRVRPLEVQSPRRWSAPILIRLATRHAIRCPKRHSHDNFQAAAVG